MSARCVPDALFMCPLRMRNRRLAFFGDSLGQQMFQSLLCMLAPKGPPANMRKRKAAIRDVGKEEFGFYLPQGEGGTGREEGSRVPSGHYGYHGGVERCGEGKNWGRLGGGRGRTG